MDSDYCSYLHHHSALNEHCDGALDDIMYIHRLDSAWSPDTTADWSNNELTEDLLDGGADTVGNFLRIPNI